jgi:hypothetical protein
MCGSLAGLSCEHKAALDDRQLSQALHGNMLDHYSVDSSYEETPHECIRRYAHPSLHTSPDKTFDRNYAV